ncbi:unnamed protein product [Linum tenue]|uniref:Uncharacterized protein n=1 Tax=Linum tenue TaxID=586396 RepID=A0AAV0QYL3_9ROSI|nr:unnamed protein product [Linum tenue]
MNLSGTQSRKSTPFHHLLELLEIDHPVAIDVDLPDHLAAVLEGPALLEAEGGEDGAELVHGDEAVAVLVEDVECLPYVLLLVPLVHDGLVLVELPKLVHVDEAVAVDVDLLDHLRQVPLRDVDPQVLQRVAQLFPRDLPVPVPVEHLEHSPQLVRVQFFFSLSLSLFFSPPRSN